MKYTVTGKRDRHFELLNGIGEVIGRLDYKKWLSVKADITIGNEVYEAEPTNMWQTKLKVTKSGMPVADLKMGMSQGMKIEIAGGESYHYKPAFWHNKYTLLTGHEQPILTFKPKFIWKNLGYSYTVETDDNYKETNDPLLLLILTYASSLMRRRMAAAAS